MLPVVRIVEFVEVTACVTLSSVAWYVEFAEITTCVVLPPVVGKVKFLEVAAWVVLSPVVGGESEKLLPVQSVVFVLCSSNLRLASIVQLSTLSKAPDSVKSICLMQNRIVFSRNLSFMIEAGSYVAAFTVKVAKTSVERIFRIYSA